MRRSLLIVLIALACLAGVVVAVAAVRGGAATTPDGLQVVAAENVWGSLAAQLGGSRAHVTSVITNPATDPHDYEPTAVDARAIAGAGLLIENGIGYDPWAGKLAAASPSSGRIVLDVGTLVGIGAGGNPHQWYSPGSVQRVIGAIAAGYAKLDPRNAGYYRRRKTQLENVGLARYRGLIGTIKRRYHGVKVGASESIFAPLAQALGLDLITPPSFLRAISEGAEPTAADRTTIDRQIARNQVKVWVSNSQNSTPDVARITGAARAKGIPVTTITETLTPASARFQSWQADQLTALEAALREATSR